MVTRYGLSDATSSFNISAMYGSAFLPCALNTGISFSRNCGSASLKISRSLTMSCLTVLWARAFSACLRNSSCLSRTETKIEMLSSFSACPNPTITASLTTSVSLGSFTIFSRIFIAAGLPCIAMTSAAARRTLSTGSWSRDVSWLITFSSSKSNSAFIAATRTSGSTSLSEARISFLNASFFVPGRLLINAARIFASGRVKSTVAFSLNISLGYSPIRVANSPASAWVIVGRLSSIFCKQYGWRR